ncbi:hypothetical protein BJ875DRAFT_208025 [Amylocarpus encephaloides]|uniref:Peptidase M12A domain-containing protein n=1 Tax=Amylocarpus encephaloides TaxID=45428 RepID=A0A9P7Y851_9HELO|nr:hypothetical protein BJ875DRAFT_208025 [Amylocarpus encephaloides]
MMRSFILNILALVVPGILSQNSSTYPLGHPFTWDVVKPQTSPANYSTVSYVDPRSGTRRNITYTLGDGGNVVYEDDISWGPESLLLLWAQNTTVFVPPPSKRGIGVNPSYAWPEATVTYRFDSCETRDLLRGIFESAIKEWKKGDPFLTFKELAPSPYTGTATGILTVTRHDGDRWWCYSNVALDNGGTGMRMNLQWLDEVGGASCGQGLTTVLHEMGHAIGLKHEQTRPDRASNINFDCTKYGPWTIQGCSGLAPQCCDPAVRAVDSCCNDYHNYDTADPAIYNMYGLYDCKSIMHYGAGGVLQSTAACQIDPSSTPTQGDYDAVCEIYKPFCTPWKNLNNCPPKPETCGTCNPVSGRNKCDITTSCISTGAKFHCACAAGFKAAAGDSDMTKHFRLPWENFRHLVFVPENTPCNVLCNNPNGFSPELCKEVILQDMCPL